MTKTFKKVYLILVFVGEEGKCTVHSVYTSLEKADERAQHLKKQLQKQHGYLNFHVAVIKKSLIGRFE